MPQDYPVAKRSGTGLCSGNPNARVPWSLFLGKKDRQDLFINPDCLPEDMLLKEPDHMVEADVRAILSHWQERQRAKAIKTTFEFIGYAKSKDEIAAPEAAYISLMAGVRPKGKGKPAPPKKKAPRRKVAKKSKKKGSEDEGEAESSGAPSENEHEDSELEETPSEGEGDDDEGEDDEDDDEKHLRSHVSDQGEGGSGLREPPRRSRRSSIRGKTSSEVREESDLEEDVKVEKGKSRQKDRSDESENDDGKVEGPAKTGGTGRPGDAGGSGLVGGSNGPGTSGRSGTSGQSGAEGSGGNNPSGLLSPATVAPKDRMEYLESLSSHPKFRELLDAIQHIVSSVAGCRLSNR